MNATTAVEIWNATDGQVDVFVSVLNRSYHHRGNRYSRRPKVKKIISVQWSLPIPCAHQTRKGEEVKPGSQQDTGHRRWFVPKVWDLISLTE